MDIKGSIAYRIERKVSECTQAISQLMSLQSFMTFSPSFPSFTEDIKCHNVFMWSAGKDYCIDIVLPWDIAMLDRVLKTLESYGWHETSMIDNTKEYKQKMWRYENPNALIADDGKVIFNIKIDADYDGSKCTIKEIGRRENVHYTTYYDVVCDPEDF